ncbi:MAG: hypothetical protein IPG67_14720 [Acidobacteria bacterium]|nr:hypothetical protein [Acidobacteriota bacterium]
MTTKKVSGQVTIANGATLETGIGGLDGNGYGGVTLEGTPAGSINTEGTGTFLVGSFTDFDGTINLYGKTDIEVTTNTSNPSVSLETANNGIDTINNNGTVNWRGNTLYIGSSVFNNHGTFNILSDDILQSQGSVPGVGSVFNNFSDGTVRKSNTSGVTDFMTYPFLSRFDNSGLVDIQTGKMLIHNGLSSGKFRTAANTEIEIQQNEMFTFLGADLESGGVFRNNGGTMSGSFRGTLQMLSGNVAGDMTALSPTSTLPGGTFDWRGGLIGNANMSPTPTIFIIQADAAMLIDASDQATFSGSFGNTVVTNNGTVQWTGQENTNIGVGDGGNNTGLIFHNNGTVFLQSDGTLFRHGDSSIMTFNNNASGIFKKSGGNGSTNLDVLATTLTTSERSR